MIEWGHGVGGIPTWGENHDAIVIHSAATLSTYARMRLMCDVCPASPTRVPAPVQPPCCAIKLASVHVPYTVYPPRKLNKSHEEPHSYWLCYLGMPYVMCSRLSCYANGTSTTPSLSPPIFKRDPISIEHNQKKRNFNGYNRNRVIITTKMEYKTGA